MVNVPVIARRELNAYFLSPMAYIVLTGFALAHGVFFSIFLSGAGGPIDPDTTVLRCLWLTLYLLLPAAPIVTMRLMSEEENTGAIQSLLTTPVSDAEVVLGKYMGALIFTLVMVVPVAFEVGFLAYVAEIDWGVVASGSLGLFLLIAQFVAIGLLCSALTRVQFASAIMSLVILLGLFFVWLLLRGSGSHVAAALEYLAPPNHFSSFTNGVIDSRDLIYFAATAVVTLYITVRVVEYKRWR